MSFSIPIFAALAAAALALLGGAVYLIIYRIHINRALRSGGGKPLAAPGRALAVIAVIVFALAVFVSYLAGYKAAYDGFEGASSPAVEIPPMTLRDLSALPELSTPRSSTSGATRPNTAPQSSLTRAPNSQTSRSCAAASHISPSRSAMIPAANA